MSQSTEGSKEAAKEFAALENSIVDHVFVLQPQYAVFLGVHRYDGILPDLGKVATDGWIAQAEELLAKLRAVPTASLSSERRFDHELLELLLESPLFDLRDSRDLERNPMSYFGAASLTPYIIREYAPLATRVDAMVKVLEAFPKLLEQGRHRLEPNLPEPFVKLALTIGSGLPGHFGEAEELARRGSASLGDRVATARHSAETAVRDLLHRLETEYLPHATQDFALGAQRFQKLLWVREGVRFETAELLRMGLADLKGNQDRLAQLAGGASADKINATLEKLYARHATADELIPRARAFVEETRKFVEAKNLATVPANAACQVKETPSFGRALSTASMQPPGPFEATGDEGIYYVTPVDPKWSPQRQEEWLRSLNDMMLRNVTVHEVYPGHYLQFLHLRAAPLTPARKVALSAAFAEGWAHYSEQLVIEAGLGDGQHDAEVAQLHDALLRDCRLVASIRLHTEGWSVEQATQLFQKEAHFERLPAEREAIRGTFNPEYFCYTLGKLAILEARTKYLKSHFGGSLQRFHDRLLGFGCPPVGLIDPMLAMTPIG